MAVLSVSDLSYGPSQWLSVNVNDLDALIVLDLKLLSDNLWWPFDCQGLLWASFSAIETLSHLRSLIRCFALLIAAKEVKVGSSSVAALEFSTFTRIGLLKGLVDLHWWEELSFSEERVNLLHKLKRAILLVENERIDIVDNDWNLSSLEE
jgi:hypothetical protein